ncbi:MAG TPA: class I SAM-dependent methyltransferase [Casimicrobiaceae bacterium]|jgi:SAM-dependent methyltransferase
MILNRLGCFVPVLALAFAAGHAGAQAVKPHGDEIFTPTPGQVGKDVMWLGTPEAMVTAMLRAAKTGPDDFVADLGAGDGRIAIAAAKEFGARSMGIEYEPKMAALAKRNAERVGVGDRVTIVHGDIFKEDFSRASVVTLYLLPELNLQLRPQILAMKPGTRVVSYTFTMADWEPDETIKGSTFDAYLWVVPAPVGGRWSVADERGTEVAVVDIAQQFQKIGGTILVGGKAQPLLGPFMSGREIGFSYHDRDGAFRAVRLTVDGTRATGVSRLGEYEAKLTARRS